MTKFAPLTLSFVALLASAAFMNGQEKSEEPAVRKVIADFAAAINRGDAKAFGELFTEDADFVVITGKYLKGRSEIVTYHAGLLGRRNLTSGGKARARSAHRRGA